MFPDKPLIQIAMVAFKALCACVVTVCAMFTVFAVGPAIEQRFFPVVSKLHVLDARELIDGRTEIHAAFKKIRDCEYLGITWFVGDRKKEFERVPIILLRPDNDTSSPNRPVGYQKAGPWIIGASAADFRERSFSQLLHRCHPFWITATDFYP